MSRIIRDRAIVDDAALTVTTQEQLDAAPAHAALIVALPLWLAQRDALLARGAPVGVLLAPNDTSDALVPDFDRLALIAIAFPQFADGRGYSIARLLRERQGWKGELRAVGDILRDQLFYLHRCGFNAFAIRADRDIDDALKAFDDFSDSYQTGVDQPVPLFRRRLAQGVAGA